MRSILITGGAGFIGSHFILHFLKQNSHVRVVNLDALTYAANEENLASVQNDQRYRFVHGNILDRSLVRELFRDFNFEGVLHFAAESHVDNSIEDPDRFLQTNVNGTHVLLQEACRFWNGTYKGRFLQVSTDEVFGSIEEGGRFTEQSAYRPNSPYSATKAAADLLARSYFRTYGLDVVITNCSNNFGPFQHDEKLIPTIIRNALQRKPIPVYGDGKNVRDWIFVDDHCCAIEFAYRKGRAGESYAIGGDCEMPNIEIAQRICSLLDQMVPATKPYAEQIAFVKDRPGHDRRYAVDSSKIQEQLGWRAVHQFDQAIKKTVEHYVARFQST